MEPLREAQVIKACKKTQTHTQPSEQAQLVAKKTDHFWTTLNWLCIELGLTPSGMGLAGIGTQLVVKDPNAKRFKRMLIYFNTVVLIQLVVRRVSFFRLLRW